VLDEGHVVRNPASKVAQAARRAGGAAQHRLLLSGTPVQNSVPELWALFDFLMPGLLGSHQQFNARYGRALHVRGRWGEGHIPPQHSLQRRLPRHLLALPAALPGWCARRLHPGWPRHPAQAARGSRRGSAESEAGLLAVEGLNRAVQPFILRRTKDAVLADLPPKILQDIVVEASPLQRHLYQHFHDSQVGPG
jgi:TATA-binding protein-associated factor